MIELPIGWIEVPLMDFIQFLPTGVPSFNGEKEYYSTGSIQNSNYDPEGKFTFDSRPSRANRLSRVGDVFQARMKGTDKGLLIEERINEKLFSTGFIQLRPNEKTYESKLLYYFVKSKIFIDQKDELATGSTQEALTDAKAKDLKILVPPLNEQKRIVEKLDKLITQVDESKRRLDKIPVIIKRFRQSVLNAAVTGELTKDWRENNKDIEPANELLEKIRRGREESYRIEFEIAQKKKQKKPKKPENLHPVPFINGESELPFGWIKVTFKDISCIKHYAMSSGPFGSALGIKDYLMSGIPVIRGQNIQPADFINSSFVYVSENKATELKRSHTIPGDIVIVAVGAGVGNSAIVPNSIEYAVLSQNCNKFTVDGELANNRFILAALQISILRSQMEESTTDTARQFLSLTNLKKMVFPLPPLEEQKEIIKRVDALFKKADEIEERYKKAKTFVDKLTQSILAKAFRGELVPQDPNDEPAEKLLERVKAEKEKLGKEKGKKKKIIQEIIKKHPKALRKLSRGNGKAVIYGK